MPSADSLIVTLYAIIPPGLKLLNLTQTSPYQIRDIFMFLKFDLILNIIRSSPLRMNDEYTLLNRPHHIIIVRQRGQQLSESDIRQQDVSMDNAQD